MIRISGVILHSRILEHNHKPEYDHSSLEGPVRSQQAKIRVQVYLVTCALRLVGASPRQFFPPQICNFVLVPTNHWHRIVDVPHDLIV